MSQYAVVEAGIRRLHARYADAVWRKDVDSFADCFTAEARWLIAGQVVDGRAMIAATIAPFFDHAHRIHMDFATPLVDPAGTRHASARTAVTERVSWLDGRANMNLGRYYERFVEAPDGRWRFEWRLFQKLYSGPPDLSGQWFDEPDFGPPPGMPPLDYVP